MLSGWKRWEDEDRTLHLAVTLDNLDARHMDRVQLAMLAYARMTAVETRDMLLRLAADLHETITGKRSGAVLVEDGEVMPALGALGGGPDRATDALRARLHDIHRTRMIR